MLDGDGEPLVGIGFISTESSDPGLSISSTSTSVKDDIIDILEADGQITGEKPLEEGNVCCIKSSSGCCTVWYMVWVLRWGELLRNVW